MEKILSRQKEKDPNTAQQTPYQEEDWGYQSESTDWSAADTWHDESYYGQYDDSYDWQGSWSYFVESVEDGQPDHRTTNEKKSYSSLMSTKDQFRVFGQHCINAFVAIFVCIAFAARILNSVMFPEDHDDCPASVGLSNSEPSDHAYLNVHHDLNLTLLTEYIDLKTHPTYVILDSGCTKAMGSRYAIDRLVHACKQHKDSHNIWFSTESCFSRFAFANGEQSTVRERLIIHLRNRTSTTGWITTSVDILDKGRVPILFSVEQMRNLRMNIEHTPVGEFLTCPMFGMKKTPLAVSTSSPLCLLRLLRKNLNIVSCHMHLFAQHVKENIGHTLTRMIVRKPSRRQNLHQQNPRRNLNRRNLRRQQ